MSNAISRVMLSTLSLFLLFNFSLFAQEKTINGRVVSSQDGTAVSGASVTVKGTSRVVSADNNGNFSVTVPATATTLTISSVGFIEKDFTVGNSLNSVFSLEPSLATEKDVIVIGYGTRNKKNITGSVVKIDPEQIRDMPFASPDQLIQGRAAGVQVSSMSGTPGGGVTVRVRGTSSFSPGSGASLPLYIVDGVFVNNTPLGPAGYGTEQQVSNPIADLNPSDIQSIEILKDANSTAIYGSRGANGVIIITTKRGSYGQKPKVTLNTFYASSKANKLPEVVNGPQTGELLNEIWINDGKDPNNLPYPNPSSLATYERLNQIFQTAPTANVDINVSGGNDKTAYYLGGSYFKQEGILKPQTFDRASFRLNLDNYISKRLKISTSNTVSRTFREIVPNDNSTAGLLTAVGNSVLYPIYNPDGTYYRGPVGNNAIALVNENDQTSTGIRYIGNIYGEWEVIPGMFFRSSWSLDYNDSYNRAFNSTILNGPGSVADAYEQSNRQSTWINEQTLRYALKLSSTQQFNFLVGNTVQKTTTRFFGVSANNFPNDDLRNISSASQSTGWNGDKIQNTLASFFGRVDYTLNNRYIFDINMRGDASSKFGANNQWGFFPSAGVAWRISSEDFMQDQNTFSDLKLKASYGLTGSQETISEYASRGLWAGNDNYIGVPGTGPSQIANPDLKWEQTTQFNIGVEFGLFNNRLTGEINYYDKFTKGLLLNKTIPMTTGFSTIAYNGGDMSNKGVEFSVNAGIIRSQDFTWDVNLNVAHNKNLIKKLDAPYFEPFSRRFILFQEGYPVNGFWLWKQEGVDPQTGNAVYADVDKNGVTDDNDRMILGSNQPEVFGGLASNLRYKNFDFSFAFNFEWGQEVVNWSTFFMVHGGTRFNAATGKATWGFYNRQLDRWQKPGDITDIPKVGGTAEERANNYGRYTSRAMEDGSYTRLRTVTLGYTLPSPVTQRIGINSVRFYVMGTNLLTITNYSGLDPEINAGGGKGTVNGVEMFTVPQPKSVQAGLSVTF